VCVVCQFITCVRVHFLNKGHVTRLVGHSPVTRSQVLKKNALFFGWVISKTPKWISVPINIFFNTSFGGGVTRLHFSRTRSKSLRVFTASQLLSVIVSTYDAIKVSDSLQSRSQPGRETEQSTIVIAGPQFHSIPVFSPCAEQTSQRLERRRAGTPL
jgi:hypothetical protein